MFNNVYRYLRTDDWLDSKVPFMISVALLSYLYIDNNISCIDMYLSVGAYFLYVSMFLAFSYVINDFTDMEIDKKAGKKKVMHKLPKPVIVITMIALVFVGVLPMFAIVVEKVSYLVYTLVLYIAGSAYSVPYLLRFKERGFIGLIECSVAQRCMPLIPIVFLFPINWIFLGVFIILSFVNGIRYILIHQAIDYENDIKTGVKTYVSEGHNKYKAYVFAAFFIECLLFIEIFAWLAMHRFYVLCVLLLYCVFELIIDTVVKKYMKTNLFCTFIAVPLEALYNVFFPIMAAILLTIENYAYCGILAFLIIITFKPFKGKFAFVIRFCKIKRKKKKESYRR